MPRLFISSYFGNGPMIETVLVPLAASLGFEIVSTWHRDAKGPEMLDRMTDAQVDAINAANDADLAAADCVLVVTHEKSAQTYCELTRAILFGKLVAVNTCARDLPEARRPGVRRFSNSRDALTWLSYESSARISSRASTLPPPPMPEDPTSTGADDEYREAFHAGPMLAAKPVDDPPIGHGSFGSPLVFLPSRTNVVIHRTASRHAEQVALEPMVDDELEESEGDAFERMKRECRP